MIGSAARTQRSLKPPWHVPFYQEVCTTMSVDTTMSDAAPDAAATAETAVADTHIDTETDTAAETAPGTDSAPETAALDTGTEVTFASLDLPKPLVDVLTEAGVHTAFPIQAATIPDALVGRDVLGRGRTGSGKTLAFGLPTLARLEGLRAKPRKPLALVLVPTRELAMQVEDALRPYARALRLRIRSVYGGAPMRKQIDGLRYGVELLVATPGRLSDLIERGECELDEVDVAILDEADQMCDMGFLPHVCELMDQVAEGGQRLLFSATLDGAVDEIVTKYMKDPVLHEVDPQAGAVTTMSHHLLLVTPQHKAKVAAQIAARHAVGGGNAEARSIFFVRTQMAVDRVTEQLRERGLPAAGLHGGMTQVARTKTLEDFKEGRTPVLIATDVAARGIHVDGIDLVVHLDPARDSKDYLHRAGRTARAGQSGVVASLILPKQRRQAQRMMDDAGVTAEELDAAPLGAGPKWEAAGAALVELTGAREVPEPGDVTPFTMPVRERERDRDRPSRYGERRDGDRYNGDRYKRDDRRGGFGGDGARSGGGYPRRDGERFDRGNRDAGRGTAPERGFVRKEGERFERDDRRSAAPPERGFVRKEGERFDRPSSPERGFVRRDGERDERRGASSPDGGFARRDGGRDYGRNDRGGRPFEQRDGGNRDGWRGGASSSSAGRGYEGRGSTGRGFENRDAQRGGTEARTDGSRPEGRPAESGRYEKRGFENRGFDSRGTGGRGFNERGTEGRSWSDRSDRSRGAERSAPGERFGRDDRRGGAGPRPRPAWDRGKPQHVSRDGKPRS